MKRLFTSFLAVLCLVAAANAQIVISEIMYNPPEAGTDSLEYIELHNPTGAAIDLSGWSFGGVDLVFDPGTSIPAGGYLLTALRASAMQNLFGKTAVQWLSGALTNSGETLKLFNSAGAVADEVTYDDGAPWPTDAAGNGSSLELCDPNADNNLPANWKPGSFNTGVTINGKAVLATPGGANTATCLPDADYTVTVQDFFFSPADLTINQGESVIWVNQQGTHNVNGTQATFPSNPASFTSGAPAAAPWHFVHVFDVAGVYSYRCDPHAGQGMTGKITVLPKAQAKIVVTEFMYNDPGPDSLEFVEIYNNGTEPVDLSGWAFTQGVEFVFPAGSSIAPGQYQVLAKFSAAFQAAFGFAPAYQFNGALNNTGEDVELRNASNDVVDYFDYKVDAPWAAQANGGGPSLVLCNVNDDNEQPQNWRIATTPTSISLNGTPVFANPGAPAGCPTDVIANDDAVSTLVSTSVTFNPLSNDFLPNPATNVSIAATPAHGTAAVNADKTITYTPASGYCGADELTYSVTDGITSATAKVSISVKCYPKYTLPQVSGENASGVADSLGVFCEVEGIVYGVNLHPQGLRFTIIDGQNNGLHVFRDIGAAGYSTVKEGDGVTIRGRISQFNGLTQINPDTVIKASSNNGLVVPKTVTKLDESTESQLIKLFDLRLVDPTEWKTGVGTFFTARAVSPAHPSDTITIFVDTDTETHDRAAPLNPFNLTGLGGQFDASSPYTSGYQLVVRYNADVDEIIATDEADFSQEVRLLPNPAAITLRLRTTTAFDQVQIIAPTGAVLRTLTEPDLEELIDVQPFASGVYFVRFEKDGAAWTTRFVKM